MKMRILMVVPLPPPWAGVEQISQMICHSYLKDDCDFIILRSNVRHANADKGAWNFQGISRVLILCGKLFFFLLAKKPDIVYMTLSQNLAGFIRDSVYVLICKIFGVPVVAHLHGSQLGIFLHHVPLLVNKFALFILNRIAKIVVCSLSIKEELHVFVEKTKVHTIYNACPPEAFVHKAIKNYQTHKKQTFVVAFMGHLSVAKGFYDLMFASSQILKQRSDIRFIFAGERLDKERNITFGNQRLEWQHYNWDFVENLIRLYPNSIDIKGVVTDQKKLDFFAEADLFVLPSYAEAFPVSILEAMASGLPLIVSPVGALNEVLVEKKNCMFVNPGQPDELIQHILFLRDNFNLTDQMTTNNLQLAKSYNIDRMAKELKALFDSLQHFDEPFSNVCQACKIN